MQANRGLVFWGVALITAGAVALAVQSGVIPGETARDAWRFWPIVLVIIGLAIIAARTPFALAVTLLAGLVVGGLGGTLVAGWPDGISIGCGGEPTERLGDQGSFTGDSASVELDFNCGELAVTTAAGSDWSLEARHGRDDAPEVTSSDDALRVVHRGGSGAFFSAAEAREEWDVTLPADIGLDMTVGANAASSELVLTDATFTRLDIDANAGEVELALDGSRVADFSIGTNAGSVAMTVDADTELDGSIGMNAGSFELCAPEGVAIEISVEDANITFSHDLDESNLSRSGDTWSSGDGPADVRLSLDGNAASFSYNPDGGCS
jgi:hypothetical protein